MSIKVSVGRLGSGKAPVSVTLDGENPTVADALDAAGVEVADNGQVYAGGVAVDLGAEVREGAGQ